MSGKDRWYEWLMTRRDAGDSEERRATVEALIPVRDRILANAAIRPGDVVLDVGTGDGLVGFGAIPAVGSTGRVIMSDVSQDLLEHCRACAVDIGVDDRCEFIMTKAEELGDIASESVDVVTVRSVLIYVRDKMMALRSFHRVLKPGGRLSAFEPINRFGLALREARLFGYDARPIEDIANRINACFCDRDSIDTNPMLGFDERNLLDFAERAGFGAVNLDLSIRIAPPKAIRGANWDAFLKTAPNPNAPTVAEAVAAVLSKEEARQFEAYLRPLVESCVPPTRLALAYLWTIKTSGDSP